MFTAVLGDVVHAVGDVEYFKKTESVRSKHVQSVLGAEYPSSIVSYLVTVQPSTFAFDVGRLSGILGEKQSLFAEGSQLKAEENALFAAFVEMVDQSMVGLPWENTSNTSTLFTWLRDTLSGSGAQERARVLVREMQDFLREVMDVDSAQLQIAAPVSAERMQEMVAAYSKEGQGIASVQVNRELLGGVRVFKNGKLTDASWRGRLNRLFT